MYQTQYTPKLDDLFQMDDIPPFRTDNNGGCTTCRGQFFDNLDPVDTEFERALESDAGGIECSGCKQQRCIRYRAHPAIFFMFRQAGIPMSTIRGDPEFINIMRSHSKRAGEILKSKNVHKIIELEDNIFRRCDNGEYGEDTEDDICELEFMYEEGEFPQCAWGIDLE